MKTILFVFVFWVVGTCSAFAFSSNGKVSQAVAASARSVVGVVAADASGHVLAQNSGVVIGKGLVLGSCHVLAAQGASKWIIKYRHKTYPAVLHKMDVPDDACSFVSRALPAPPIAVDDKVNTSAGQKIYVIGATHAGLPVISMGKLTSLQKNNGMRVRKLSVSLTRNIIGGGVFDASGRLIGIHCLGPGKGGKGWIALPRKEVDYLANYGVSSGKSDGAYRQVSQEDLQAIDMLNHGNYSGAVRNLQALAEKSDARAEYNLDVMYDSGYGVAKNERKADDWLIKSAKQGNANAELQLGAAYLEGAGDIPKDGVKATHWLGMAAQHSVVMAQVALGTLYIEGDRVARDLPKGIRLIRRAADQGSGVAQFALGGAYVAGKGVKRNRILGAKWLMLARDDGSRRAAGALSRLEKGMSTTQIAKARRLAGQWSAHGMP